MLKSRYKFNSHYWAEIYFSITLAFKMFMCVLKIRLPNQNRKLKDYHVLIISIYNKRSTKTQAV